MIKFEKVSRFVDSDISMPNRKTAQSAGYDFVVAEDTVVPAYQNHNRSLMMDLIKTFLHQSISNDKLAIDESEAMALARSLESAPKTLDEIAQITKRTKAKPTLVSTGMKCKLDPDTYLELSVRSSSPLKYWLILANGVGIIDADYYNNPDNEGEIFFQMINLSPYDIVLKKGDAIGQGIIKHYLTTEDDVATGSRTGGFGSTGVR